jgi:hypothetical protein
VLLRNAAFAGMIGPALFALIVVVLSVAQYGFMVDLGWDPIGSSDVPWPSGLALGPLGWLQHQTLRQDEGKTRGLSTVRPCPRRFHTS